MEWALGGFFIAFSLYVFISFSCSFHLLLSWTQWILWLYCLVYCPSFTIFLIIFNFSLLLFSCCSDTISLRGSINFHLIWTWWNCVTLSEELSLLYLVQILNWVWRCDPAALILRLMDFFSKIWLLPFWRKYLLLVHLCSRSFHPILTFNAKCWALCCILNYILISPSFKKKTKPLIFCENKSC